MAPVLVNFTLLATVLVGVVIAGPPNFNMTNLSEISSLNLFENSTDVSIKASEDVEGTTVAHDIKRVSHCEYYNDSMLINSTPTPASEPRTLPEGYVRFPDLHSAYKVYTTGVTWVEARDKCILEGAHLAITDTFEKINRIRSMQPYVWGDWINVGIHKSNTTDDWVRVDNGLPLASIPWNPAESFEGDWFNCSAIPYSTNGLFSTPCTSGSHWYVCEISI